MNICLVAREYPPETDWGGIATYTYQLAQGLTEEGHRVHILCLGLTKEQDYQDKKVFVHRVRHKRFFASRLLLNDFGGALEYSWLIFQKLRKLVETEKIEIVEGPDTFAECLAYSFFRKIPLVTRIHTPGSKHMEITWQRRNLDNLLLGNLENAVLMQSDLVMPPTVEYAGMLLKQSLVSKSKIAVVPLGIKLPDLEVETQNDKDHRPLSVLFVGRL